MDVKGRANGFASVPGFVGFWVTLDEEGRGLDGYRK
jgi:hypothetical protein